MVLNQGVKGEESINLSTGLLHFSLIIAHAVQLGFSLNDTDSIDTIEEKKNLLLTLFKDCFAMEELRNEAIFPIVMHPMEAAGIDPSQLLETIRCDRGSSVEVALKVPSAR